MIGTSEWFELDAGVVHAQAAERREQVFDGIDRRVTRDQARLEMLLSAQV